MTDKFKNRFMIEEIDCNHPLFLQNSLGTEYIVSEPHSMTSNQYLNDYTDNLQKDQPIAIDDNEPTLFYKKRKYEDEHNDLGTFSIEMKRALQEHSAKNLTD